MNFKIVVDSSCDITNKMKQNMNVEITPLTIELEGTRYRDDDSFQVDEFVQEMNASTNVPKTACPSPAEYIDRFAGEEENVFVITLSSKLSGSYNSAEIAKDIYLSENDNKNIHVFDSLSASAGEVLLTLKIDYLAKLGKTYTQIVDSISNYIKEMKTLFVLNKLDNLVKTGRMSLVKAAIANVLNIKPVLASNGKGEIIMINKGRGINKAISKMIAAIGETKDNLEDSLLVIAHCNCFKRANSIKEKVNDTYNFKDIFIVEMKGLSSTYANDGGIVIAF
ncbi:DegV family protein [Vallitalea sediminicola]